MEICLHILRFLEGNLCRKSLTESNGSDRFYPGKFPKIFEHVSYSIRYCSISLLIYSGCTSLQTPGVF